MLEHGENDDRTLPHPSAGDIQAACFQFEKAWRAKELARLEDFLAGIPFEAQGALLQELIVTEMNLRMATGQSINAEEYRQRFPSCESEVAAADE